MTVKELIEKLQMFEQNIVVAVRDGEYYPEVFDVQYEFYKDYDNKTKEVVCLFAD